MNCIGHSNTAHTPFLEVHDQLLGALLYQLLSVVSLSLHHLQLAVLLAVQPLQLLALLRRAAGRSLAIHCLTGSKVIACQGYVSMHSMTHLRGAFGARRYCTISQWHGSPIQVAGNILQLPLPVCSITCERHAAKHWIHMMDGHQARSHRIRKLTTQDGA